MGRLLNPGLGELADRLTILELKLAYAPAGAEVDHFREEHAQVQMRVDNLVKHCGEARQLAHEVNQLKAINAVLWRLEDKMATFVAQQQESTDGMPELALAVCAGVAMNIWRQNRARNAQIDRINQLAGQPARPEKF